MSSEYSNSEPIKLSKSSYTILCHKIKLYNGYLLCWTGSGCEVCRRALTSSQLVNQPASQLVDFAPKSSCIPWLDTATWPCQVINIFPKRFPLLNNNNSANIRPRNSIYIFLKSWNCSYLFVGSTEAPWRVFLLFSCFLIAKVESSQKSNRTCFLDIFSRHICSSITKTMRVTNYATSFGATKCSENQVRSWLTLLRDHLVFLDLAVSSNKYIPKKFSLLNKNNSANICPRNSIYIFLESWNM